MRSPTLLLAVGALCLGAAGCVPTLDSPARDPDTHVPATYATGAGPADEADGGADTAATTTAVAAGAPPAQSSAEVEPTLFFDDPRLRDLIDAALKNNQELNIAALEVLVSRNEVTAREGEYLPKIELRAGGGVDKPGKNETIVESEEDAGEYVVGLFATWELDIWKKLRNARSAAAKRYMASISGRRFLVTNVVAEVASSYYELLGLDNQLDVLRQNIAIQQQALEVVRLQKQAGQVSELAVKRFEAEVLKNQSRVALVQQQIVEVENRLNLLTGRFHQPIVREPTEFMSLAPNPVREGAPAELLANRPDVKQAELELEAAKLDVEVARARFYPSLELNAGVACREAFELANFPSSPVALAYKVAAELVQPIWNRKELKAGYFSANSKQMQAVFGYEQTILRAYTEVSNQLAMVSNLAQSYALRQQEVDRLTDSIEISANLFKSARADYMEVLLTRRDALEAQMELIETKTHQLDAVVKLYRALGGGWR